MTDKSQRKSIAKQTRQRLRRGFTIVELLIVIVVIAILAAISVVAYTGIQKQAVATTLKSDLKQASTVLEKDRILAGNYPTSMDAGVGGANEGRGIKPSGDGEFQYTLNSNGSYCLTAQSKGQSFYYTSTDGGIKEGYCTGDNPPVAGGGGGGNEIAANSPIQNVTSAQCQALPEFTGSNTSAIRTVTDNRGGTTRTYEIAKLADGKCWMLTNLKLGSTTGTITLTPADSNVASNFTLPQLTTGGTADSDNPRAYGPVPGDTGSGSTNYGYLYNFPAATAGESRTTMPAGGGNASHSICPAGWRLPTGGSPSSDFGQLDVAFGGTGAYASGGPSVAKWQPSGPFKGSFSGNWFGGFAARGDAGNLWSASAYPGSPDRAFGAYFSPTSHVAPGGGNNGRGGGVGVRCLLN